MTRIGDQSEGRLRDFLWARFRTVAQRIMISEQLKAEKDNSLESYETYYSDFIDDD